MEYWNMTQKEVIQSLKGQRVEKYSYYNRLGAIQSLHRNSILWAFQFGKTIPEEVLKDYPDIVYYINNLLAQGVKHG